jgi:hypothetical protein
MEEALSLVFVCALFYALGREHGARRGDRPRRSRGDANDWTPFDGFYSDR